VQQGLSDPTAYVPAPPYWIWDVAVYGSLVGPVALRGPLDGSASELPPFAIFLGIVALALAFPLINFIEGHYDSYAPSRYALPALPIIAVLVMRTLRTRAVVIIGIILPALAIGFQLTTTQF
jgi:hypothetical protein